jgi:phospholipid/cholesterol/gamma-HCH transport system permease protein
MSVAAPPPPPAASPPPASPPPPSRRRADPPSGPVGERIHNSGLILKFSGLVVGDLLNGRVFMFAGEILRQAGILIVSSTLVTWGLVLFVGLQCGIEGAYLLQAQGAPQYAGLFSAWCDLRELAPLTFGYMMAAKVGTGIVAELGAMRISDEIDALEVMGIRGITFLCTTRLLAAWLVFPFVYIGAVAWGFLASYIAVVEEVANVSSGGYTSIFWEFQNPGDLLFSLIKAMVMTTVIVLVGCYYGYTASGGPVGVGRATAKSMVVNIVSVHVVGMLGTQLFWGANPRAPIGG